MLMLPYLTDCVRYKLRFVRPEKSVSNIVNKKVYKEVE